MEGIIEPLLEYGMLVAVLAFGIIILWRQNKDITKQLIQLSKDSIESLTELTTLIKGKDGD